MTRQSSLLFKTLVAALIEAAIVIFVCHHVLASANAGTYTRLLATPGSSAKWELALYNLSLMLFMGWLLNCLSDSIRQLYSFATARASSSRS